MDCRLCAKRLLCKNYGNVCEKYEKEHYKEVIKENGIKKIRRIEE